VFAAILPGHFKGTVHSKTGILSSFAHPLAIKIFISTVENTKQDILKNITVQR